MSIEAERQSGTDGSTPDDGANDTANDPVVMSVSDAAMDTVIGIRAEEDRPESLGLRVEITGVKGPEFTYDLSFEELDAVDEDHHRYTVGDLTVVIPSGSVDNLRGAELDLPRNAAQGGLVIRNPNRPDPLAGIQVELTGDIAERVTQLLEQVVNPALASHGGYATLVGVDEDDKVYVTMGGGCQGCSASAATLTEGIRRSILEHVPEVTDVVDATDHAAGENPFYS